jgi:hypothetical protein
VDFGSLSSRPNWKRTETVRLSITYMYPEEKRYDVRTTVTQCGISPPKWHEAWRLSRMWIPMHDTTHGPILRDWQMQTLIT